MNIILASASPRRIELLGLLCDSFDVCPSDVDETVSGPCSPEEFVQTLACRKCRAVAEQHPDALVIGADTVVTVDGTILGKPHDREDAARMLRLLSGRTHTVYTGVALHSPLGSDRFSVGTQVMFYPLDEDTIRWYLDTGESFDKAGAYGIQGKGTLLIRGIEGDYFNVVGFPVSAVARRMKPLYRP